VSVVETLLIVMVVAKMAVAMDLGYQRPFDCVGH